MATEQVTVQLSQHVNEIAQDSPCARVYRQGAIPGWGTYCRDSCHRRRNRLETCLKNQRNVNRKHLSLTEMEKKRYIVRDFSKSTRTYEYCCSSMEEQQKNLTTPRLES